jgi:hypothetical protein
MTPTTHTRLAWGIACASLALWATTVPAAFTAQSADTPDMTQPEMPCPPPPSAAADSAPPTPIPTLATEGSFRLCGADPAAERAIEQLVAGRGFSTTLTSRADGCADLLVRVNPQSAGTSGRAQSILTVSLGGGQTLSVQIASENGATHAHIG